jgi:hypothetical protein
MPAIVPPRGAVNWQLVLSCWSLHASSASGGGPNRKCKWGGTQTTVVPPGKTPQVPETAWSLCWKLQDVPVSRPAQASTAS